MQLPFLRRQSTQQEDFRMPLQPMLQPQLIKFSSDIDNYCDLDLIRNDSFKLDSFLQPPPLRPRRTTSSQGSQILYPIPIYQKQDSIIEKQEYGVQQEQNNDINNNIKKQQSMEQNNKKQKIQKKTKTFKIQQKKIKKNELDKQPCFCKNSGCLKRYCRCFHSGRMCFSECQCKEGCQNNHQNLEERNKAIKHVNEKCHRNKNVPKDALFKLKESFGCNCKNTHCQKGYCECFLRKQKCTIECQCENCENGLDEAYIQSQQQKKNYRVRNK